MSHAEASCVLKINMHCEACKWKFHEILSSIAGVYSVTIDGDRDLATVCGEVDPNILLKAISRNGKHAELKWVKLKSPSVKLPGYPYNNHYGNGSHGSYYGATLDQRPYDYRDSRALTEGMYHELPQNIYPNPNYYITNNSNYGYYGGRCNHSDSYHNCSMH